MLMFKLSKKKKLKIKINKFVNTKNYVCKTAPDITFYKINNLKHVLLRLSKFQIGNLELKFTPNNSLLILLNK
jgi:hypothetical protein